MKYYVMVRWPKDIAQCSFEVKGACAGGDKDVRLCRLGNNESVRVDDADGGFDVTLKFPKNTDLDYMNKTFPEFVYEILEVEVT